MEDVRQFRFGYFLVTKLSEGTKTWALVAKFECSPKECSQSHCVAGWASQHLVRSLNPCDVIWTVRSSNFFADLLSPLLDVAGIFCCTAVSAPIPPSKLTLAECVENRGKTLKCDGPDSFTGTAKEHDWRGSGHLHEASILEAKARGRQKLSVYTHRHLRLVTHLLAVFSLKALHVKFWQYFYKYFRNHFCISAFLFSSLEWMEIYDPYKINKDTE